MVGSGSLRRPYATRSEPRLVIASSVAAMDACLDRIRRSGMAIAPGWTVPPAGYVCAGTIATAEDAEAALLAALAGTRIVALLASNPALSALFYEDLQRIGPVELVDDPLPGRLDGLGQEQLELLGLLGDGLSIGDAAARLHLSRRSADRRLAAARRVLGVQSNAEAIFVARRQAG